jgi:hypothetical protein
MSSFLVAAVAGVRTRKGIECQNNNLESGTLQYITPLSWFLQQVILVSDHVTLNFDRNSILYIDMMN